MCATIVAAWMLRVLLLVQRIRCCGIWRRRSRRGGLLGRGLQRHLHLLGGGRRHQAGRQRRWHLPEAERLLLRLLVHLLLRLLLLCLLLVVMLRLMLLLVLRGWRVRGVLPHLVDCSVQNKSEHPPLAGLGKLTRQ